MQGKGKGCLFNWVRSGSVKFVQAAITSTAIICTYGFFQGPLKLTCAVLGNAVPTLM